jgi:hypothetical protein
MRTLRSIVLALLMALPVAAPARAESLTFWMASNHDYEISLEFSSSKTRVWPGNGRYYVLDDYEPHSFKLNCQRGEKVCYGAWETGGEVRWGMGFQRDRRCTSCCYTCNGATTQLITLQPE